MEARQEDHRLCPKKKKGREGGRKSKSCTYIASYSIASSVRKALESEETKDIYTGKEG
jgi:hypothetical protein